MSDELFDESDSSELSQLLSNAAVWAEPSVEVEDRVVAAITAELTATEDRDEDHDQNQDQDQDHDRDHDQNQDKDGPVIDLGEHRTRRAGARRFWPLAAAAAVLIIGVSAAAGFAFGRWDRAELTTVALAPTDLAPGYSAVARIDERPNGTRLQLDLSGVEPAPVGFFYEVWLVKEEPRTVISAGTFHMRGSHSGEIEFWAGVSPQVYSTITVTLESEAAPSAPGELILEGQVPAS